MGGNLLLLTYVRTLQNNHAKSGECFGGKYLWISDLILVDDTSRSSITTVVRDLLARGEFKAAFRRCADQTN